MPGLPSTSRARASVSLFPPAQALLSPPEVRLFPVYLGQSAECGWRRELSAHMASGRVSAGRQHRPSGSCQQQEKLCRLVSPALIEGPVPSLKSPCVLLAIRAHPDTWSHFPTKNNSLAQLPPRPVISVLWCRGSHRASGACRRQGIVLVQNGFLLSWSR